MTTQEKLNRAKKVLKDLEDEQWAQEAVYMDIQDELEELNEKVRVKRRLVERLEEEVKKETI